MLLLINKKSFVQFFFTWDSLSEGEKRGPLECVHICKGFSETEICAYIDNLLFSWYHTTLSWIGNCGLLSCIYFIILIYIIKSGPIILMKDVGHTSCMLHAVAVCPYSRIMFGLRSLAVYRDINYDCFLQINSKTSTIWVFTGISLTPTSPSNHHTPKVCGLGGLAMLNCPLVSRGTS